MSVYPFFAVPVSLSNTPSQQLNSKMLSSRLSTTLRIVLRYAGAGSRSFRKPEDVLPVQRKHCWRDGRHYRGCPSAPPPPPSLPASFHFPVSVTVPLRTPLFSSSLCLCPSRPSAFSVPVPQSLVPFLRLTRPYKVDHLSKRLRDNDLNSCSDHHPELLKS